MYIVRLEYGKIEEAESADCQFRVCHYFDACFDFNFPFRPLLAFIRDGMRTKESRVELVLPEYFEYEDFVEGCFDLGDRQIGVYFEHSLAYVSFAADHPECLTLLKETTEGSVFRHDGYGLADAGRFTGNA